MYSMFADLDQGWDSLLDPDARPTPRRILGAIPPPIAHGEVTTNHKSARERAYAQLIQHQLVGVPAQRRRGERRPGELDPPMAQQRPGENVGLALVDPSTGAVEYTVFAPNALWVLWRGPLCWPNSTPLPGNRSTPEGREVCVRTLLERLTGQRFQTHPVYHSGPDLISISTQQLHVARRPSVVQRSPRASPPPANIHRLPPPRLNQIAAFF